MQYKYLRVAPHLLLAQLKIALGKQHQRAEDGGRHTHGLAHQSPLINATIDASVCGRDALTDSYGWFVQALLASLAFGLLILKRFCEPKKHRRSWLVWFYDTSKQGLGAMIVHFCNVFLSEAFKGDPCTWYIISFLLDSTLGLVIIWAGIRLSIYMGQTKGMPTLIFGEYGKTLEGATACYAAFVVYMTSAVYFT
ncbi:store-operated calcium entry regulator STIMATE-like [Penaeus monodon]|uniref:store-operated calcium entry regulator STIMATE-like n=1 Tax=Penaeus monodon TaxID=6687 RepID=UPI0018A79ED6|nr:store-operated calcium entry regulator STIMATE-like [Penaeus monodon]